MGSATTSPLYKIVRDSVLTHGHDGNMSIDDKISVQRVRTALDPSANSSGVVKSDERANRFEHISAVLIAPKLHPPLTPPPSPMQEEHDHDALTLAPLEQPPRGWEPTSLPSIRTWFGNELLTPHRPNTTIYCYHPSSSSPAPSFSSPPYSAHQSPRSVASARKERLPYDDDERYVILFLKEILGLQWTQIADIFSQLFVPNTPCLNTDKSNAGGRKDFYPRRNKQGLQCRYYRIRESLPSHLRITPLRCRDRAKTGRCTSPPSASTIRGQRPSGTTEEDRAKISKELARWAREGIVRAEIVGACMRYTSTRPQP